MIFYLPLEGEVGFRINRDGNCGEIVWNILVFLSVSASSIK